MAKPSKSKLVAICFRGPDDMLARIHSEVFHDPQRRTIQDVMTELLQESLSKRRNKGPAPVEWIARHKALGRRRKKS